MNQSRIFVEFWNPGTDAMEWRPFEPKDIDKLMELEIIDDDTLGYAMKDTKAFDKAMDLLVASNRAWSYGEFTEMYLSLTDTDIRIQA